MDLSVIIPARNEEFLGKTIESVLENIEGDTEVIAICDGYWPDPPIPDHDRLTLIHHSTPVGQRAGVNEGTRLSTAKYIMKLDAHCSVAKGFDVKLMAVCEPDWTVIPRMYNLHAFDWVCACGERQYQGPKPEPCKCGGQWEREIVWKRRKHKRTDFARFDNNLRFQYWYNYQRRPESQYDIADVMCSVGACFFMHRDRFFELEGLDEQHGSWGQVGVEVACKSWLSGGRQVVNKTTWFAHMFRTKKDFSFPYKITHKDQEKARAYSRDLWVNNKWPKQKHDFQWLVDKFSPVPTWVDNDLTVIYYTANKIPEGFAEKVRRHLSKSAADYPLISVSQKPLDFGENICVGDIGASFINVYKQVLTGAKAAKTKYVALAEDDCLYTADHFMQRPEGDSFGYNLNRWNLDCYERLYYYRKRPVLSQCIAPRELLIQNLEERFKLKDIPRKYCGEMGCFEKKLGMSEYKVDRFTTDLPNIVINHDKNLSYHKYVTAEQRHKLDYWGEAGKLLDSIMPDEYGIKYRYQRSRIGGKRDYPMEKLWEKRFELNEPKLSLKEFFTAYEPFVDELMAGETFMGKDDHEKIEAHPYFHYLCTKLNPVDRDPLTFKGRRHAINKLRNAEKLFHDIKNDGLKNPITLYMTNNRRLCLKRGGRRLVILHRLGWKDVPVRIFRTIWDVRRWDDELDSWHQDPKQPPSLHELGMRQFLKYKGLATDKYWIHNYLKTYDKFFGRLRNKRGVKILEIGLLWGASLRLWHQAFPKAQIYGVDKDYTRWKRLTKDLSRCKVFVGKQEDTHFLTSEVIPHGKFDIILDDCGHMPSQQWTTFQCLWPALKNHGWYIIEDTHWNYHHTNKGPNVPRELASWVDKVYTDFSVKTLMFHYNLCIIQKGVR